jgi:SAM-dependent methyltransferase/uncharacterized membrane protein YbhN (UPF0104 family)
MIGPLRRIFSINIVLVLVGAAAACLWIYLAGGRELSARLELPPSRYVLVLPAITVFWLFSRFIRWQFLLRSVGVRVPIRASLGIYLASLPGTATPAYAGELVRGIFMRRKFGTPFSVTTAVLIVERVLDVAALVLLAAATTNGWLLRGAAIASFVLIYLLVLQPAPSKKQIGMFWTVVSSLRKRTVIVRAFLISLIAWVPAAFLISVAAASVHERVLPLTGIRVFSSATLLGGITLMPAGIGTTGSLAILQLKNLGIALSSAVVIISLVRLMSTGLALSVGTIFFFFQLRPLKQSLANRSAFRFNEIALQYDGQFSEHVWSYLLERKLGFITASLPKPPVTAGLGLDLGCGLGRHLEEMRRRGYRVIGIDRSFDLIRQGYMTGADIVNGDILKLPFGDASFDFVYMIGVSHHLANSVAQEAACREVARILKPGGHFFVLETNPRNPIFRFYMGYIFPILKSIDEGTERWIEPQRWENMSYLQCTDIRYFTFLPDFTPRFLMRISAAAERFLERTRLRPYSVHYLAILRRPSAA